jgi:hypothetical protein
MVQQGIKFTLQKYLLVVHCLKRWGWPLHQGFMRSMQVVALGMEELVRKVKWQLAVVCSDSEGNQIGDETQTQYNVADKESNRLYMS